MKDHASLSDKDKYVLKYTASGKAIVAKLASGEKYVVPRTTNNETRIKNIMEEQAQKAKKDKISPFFVAVTAIVDAGLPFAFINYFTKGGLLYYIILLIVACSAIANTSNLISDLIKNKDVEKLQYFLKHRKEINENAYKTENITMGLRKRAIKQIDQQVRKKEIPINLCNIDDYSLNDLRQMRDNIKRYQAFQFEEKPLLDVPLVEEGPVLKMKPNNK